MVASSCSCIEQHSYAECKCWLKTLLPTVMNLTRDPAPIETLDRRQGALLQGRERGGSRVGAGLLGCLRTRDDGRDRLEAEDPAEGELGERRARRNQRAELVDDL